jgi:hypothetical protein
MVEKRGGGWRWSFIAIFSLNSRSSASEELRGEVGIGPFTSLLMDCLLGFMLLLTSVSKFWLKDMVLEGVLL